MLVFVMGMVWLLNSGGGPVEPNNPTGKKKRYNPEPAYKSSSWDDERRLNSKHPYGLYMFQELLLSEGKFNEFNVIKDQTLIDSLLMVDNSMYMFVGKEFGLTAQESKDLMASVGKGNDLFISADKYPRALIDLILPNSYINFDLSDSIPVSWGKNDYYLEYIYQADTLAYHWEVLDRVDYNMKVYSDINGNANYVKIEYLEGNVYLNLNPQAFLNYQLLRPDGFKNINNVIKTMPSGKIQWLAFADYKYYNPWEDDFEEKQQAEAPPGILDQLLESKETRWAVALGFLGFVLYLLFRSKRQRPLLPTFSENKDVAFNYVDTIAGIYFSKDEPYRILKVMRQNFYLAIQKHFYIDLGNRKNDKPLKSLSQKTGVPVQRITEMVENLEAKGSITHEELQYVNKKQRDFYIESGIWRDQEKEILENQFIKVNRSLLIPAVTVLLSALIIITGFILIAASQGFGILFWPLGIAGLIYSVPQLSKPIYQYNQEKFVFYKVYGKPIEFSRNDLVSGYMDGTMVFLQFTENRTQSFNMNNVDANDKNKVEELLFKLNTIDYGRE